MMNIPNLPKVISQPLFHKYLQLAEDKLANGDTSSAFFYEKALQLQPNQPSLLYREGLAYYFGGLKSKKKFLFLRAIRSFKKVDSITPFHFPSIWLCGNAYRQLYLISKSKKYLELAKKRFEEGSPLANESALGDFYWDYALVHIEIGKNSKEAYDLRNAIYCFQEAQNHLELPPQEFFLDFATCYIKLATLVNDNNLYIRAIELLENKKNGIMNEGHKLLIIANAYAQLYINTSNETFLQQACNAYQQAEKSTKLCAKNLSEYSRLLGDSGKIHKDQKKIKKAIDLAQKALSITSSDPQIIAQWIEFTAVLGQNAHRLDLILQAEKNSQTYISRYPHESELWNAYGMTLFCKGQYFSDSLYKTEAIDCFQKGLSLDRTNTQSWSLLAQTYMDVGQSEGNISYLLLANKFFAKANKLQPSCYRLQIDLAISCTILFSETNNDRYLSEALYIFESQFSKKWTTKLDTQALFHYAKALDYFGESQDNEQFHNLSIEYYRKVSLIHPDYPSLSYNRALCWSHLATITGESDYFYQAIASFQQEEILNPENDLAALEWGLLLINLAECTLEDESSSKDLLFAEAEKKLKKAGLLGNQHASYHLACLYALSKKYKLAMKFLIKSYKEGILPEIDDLMQDIWLENLHSLEQFKNFISRISSNRE